MPSFVVTGASGFIGKALCKRLADAGASVLAVSRDPGFHPPRPGVRSVALADLTAAPGDVCIHLSGCNDPQDIERHFKEHLRRAERLARRVAGAGFKRVVFASSALVYGDGAEPPRTEGEPLRPFSAYGRLKRRLERIFSGGNHIVARISNIYGPGMSSTNVFSHILGQLRRGDRVRLRALGSIRDYIFISDATAALEALARSSAHGVFNISTGRGTSVARLVALLAAGIGRKGFRVEALPETRPSVLVLDPGKLMKTVGWRPRVSIETGIKRLLEGPHA